jgi:hypothetical protein
MRVGIDYLHTGKFFLILAGGSTEEARREEPTLRRVQSKSEYWLGNDFHLIIHEQCGVAVPKEHLSIPLSSWLPRGRSFSVFLGSLDLMSRWHSQEEEHRTKSLETSAICLPFLDKHGWPIVVSHKW